MKKTYIHAVLVYRCINGTTPRSLACELQQVADIESRGRLRSSSTALLHVPQSLHKTIGDRAFPVAAASLEHATTGDHVIAVTADFQACIEDETILQIAHYRQQQH